jgi:hypothetical protein
MAEKKYMPGSDEHDGTYVSTVTGITPDPSGTLYIEKSGSDTTYSYTPTSTGVNQSISPTSHGATLTFSITISGTTYNFTGSFTPTGGGKNKRYTGSVNDNSPKLQNGTWTASSQTPVPKASRKAG